MKKLIAIIICLAAIIFVLATFTACNPTKRAYKKIEKLEPKSKADTTRLLKRAMTVIPKTQTKTLPGKIIRVPYPVDKIKTVLDSNRLKAIVDSLQDATGSVITDCSKAIEDACKVCRQQAYYELRNITYETKEPDTVLMPDPATQADLQLTNMRLIDTSISLRACRAEIASNERKMDSIGWTAKRTLSLLWGQWWWWVLLAGLGAGSYIKLRKKIPLLP